MAHVKKITSIIRETGEKFYGGLFESGIKPYKPYYSNSRRITVSLIHCNKVLVFLVLTYNDNDVVGLCCLNLHPELLN
jgi:hypothetical protein